MALALALRHRNISCIVFEKDVSFDSRCQGYGLTMQQGGRILQKLGIDDFEQQARRQLSTYLSCQTGLFRILWRQKRTRFKTTKIGNGSNQPLLSKEAVQCDAPLSKTQTIIYEKLEKSVVKWVINCTL